MLVLTQGLMETLPVLQSTNLSHSVEKQPFFGTLWEARSTI